VAEYYGKCHAINQHYLNLSESLTLPTLEVIFVGSDGAGGAGASFQPSKDFIEANVLEVGIGGPLQDIGSC
jgi:hypothetical protein